jgi:hypothetical protein
MTPIGWLLAATAAVPIVVAARANCSTSLAHACAWAGLALAAWAAAPGTGSNGWAYCALALRGCAGVAVLGARRPGVEAWNFVVVGLLIVLLLPLGEAAILGTSLHLGAFRTIFLAVLLSINVLNYLPTRLGLGAFLLGAGSAGELCGLGSGRPDRVIEFGGMPLTVWCIGLAPAVAWMGVRIGRGKESAVNRLWASFRDRYGLVWGQRLREQFNRAAANGGLNAQLGWWGLRGRPSADSASAAHEMLGALMKRFGVS